MKKKSFLLFFILILSSGVLVNAQFFTEISLLTPHYYPGIVYFIDGHSEEYVEIELPRVGKSKLGVKKKEGDKRHTDIPAVNVIGIKIWHKNYPNKVHTLYYVRARKAMLQSEHQWGTPLIGNAWGVLYVCEQYYQMNKETGDLDFVKFVGGNTPDTPTLYYLMRPEWERAELLMANGRFIQNKKASELFSENKTIASAVKKGLLKGSDIQYIFDEMAGEKKGQRSLEMIPDIQTDSVSNGRLGDDE